jgi:hypothetical protein
MTSATDRRAVLGAIIAAAGSTAALPVSAALGRPTLSVVERRVLDLWDRYREQKEHCHRLLGSSTAEEIDLAYDALFDIEHALQADIGVSIQALAAVLVIEIEDDESNEHVPGFYRASLAAIRPHLVGAITEAADRVLALANEEART